MIVETKAKDAYAVRVKSPPKSHETAKNQLNRDILDSVELSGGKQKAEKSLAGNSVDRVDLSQSMSIEDVNRLLVTEVGRKVEKMFEEAGIDPVSVADTDWSPEATAERIFRGTTGLFEIWRAQHKDMSETELIDSFEEVLRASVDQGAQEAIGLIEARGFENEENVLDTAKETMSLVHEKFDSYFESLRERLETRDEGAPTGSDAAEDDRSSGK